MRLALAQACADVSAADAAGSADVPVGAVVLDPGGEVSEPVTLVAAGGEQHLAPGVLG